MIKNRSSKLELWKKSFLLAVPLSALTAVVLLLIFQMDVRNQLQKVELSEEHNLQILAEHEQDEFEHIVTDLRVLSEHHELKKYLQQASYADIHDLHNDWGALQESRKVYDQIRFIDSSGQERIRLNLSNGSSVTVPETQLQSKSSRYYFKDTIGLDPGDIFVSPLDLNVENGRIEEPHKPMIRFGSPVFDQDGQTRGIIILNYLADDLILPMKNDLHGFSWGDVMLINADGYWLSHPVADKEWGFMLNSDERIGNDYPLAWARTAHSE
ncbi:MAG: cache domain-containing protein, partial [Desulfuromonadales bacterium]|nr:cache domain-containing protein [Desulfuromonadales bacterium]